MTLEIDSSDRRTLNELREHYVIERDLASKLRNANKKERRHLYHTVYEEMFERVPSHPELIAKRSKEETRSAVAAQLRFLGRFLRRDQTFLEVGAGDCSLSFAVASLVRKVYAIDVSSIITKNSYRPPNFDLIVSGGCDIDLPANSINVAYSNQLMEHLHPDDVLDQLQDIYRVLAPEGIYVCITPNRLNGPHDISRYFSRVATGFHLKEYTVSELSDLFCQAGFSRLSSYVGIKGRFCRLPIAVIKGCETLLTKLPSSLRKGLANHLPVRVFMQIRLVGTKLRVLDTDFDKVLFQENQKREDDRTQ